MKKSHIVLITITMLFLPIIAISFVWLIFNYFIFDNPDFWYGYMAYFGTIVLAAVALWQNHIFKLENDRSQNRLEEISKQANEINTINKILEFEHTRIHNLYKYLDELEKACDNNNISISLQGCINENIIITQTIEKCDFLFLAVTREMRMDKRGDTIKDELFELCSDLYKAAVELLKAYDNNKLNVDICVTKLNKIWKQYFITKEKYINSVQRDFSRLLYENLSLDEIRCIYYNVNTEDDNNGDE